MEYIDKLERCQTSPSNRIVRIENHVNFNTLETDTVYTLVLNDARTHFPCFMRVEAKTLHMMLPRTVIR